MMADVDLDDVVTELGTTCCGLLSEAFTDDAIVEMDQLVKLCAMLDSTGRFDSLSPFE